MRGVEKLGLAFMIVSAAYINSGNSSQDIFATAALLFGALLFVGTQGKS